MSIRKSVVNDINVLLEPVYLKSQQGNGTLLSFDVDGKVINSEITTQSVADFINDPNSAVIASTLTGFDYVGKTDYITASDSVLSALEKSQYQIDDIIFSKGANSGIATLDSSGKLTYTQIPASLIGGMIYQGTWDADTNTPELTSGTGTKGFYYIVSVSGTTSIDGISVWTANDWIVFDGAGWDKIDNSTVNVLQTPLTGYVVGSNTALSSTNTILAAFGYIQGQLNNKSNISNGTQNYLPYFSTSDTISVSTIYHSPTSNNGGSSTIINSNNTSTESLTVNDYSNNKLLGIRNDARFIFKASTLQINDINNTESSAIYIGSGDNVYSTHLYIASRITGSNDFISFHNTNASLKTFWYDYNSVLNVKSIDNSNSTSLFKLFKSDGTQISNFTNDGLVFGTTAKDVSSIIDIQTTTKGLGLPNLLTSQKTAITTNRKGLTVYDDTLKALSFWDGISWVSTINNTSSGVTYAIPYYSSPSVLSNSTLYYGETDLLKLTDVDNTNKNLFVINSFGSTNNFVISHNYTSDLTSILYDNLDTITANLSDGLVQIGGAQHINSISNATPHIVLTDSVTSIDVFKIYSTGNSVLRTTDNTATNKFFTFTNFGGTQIGYIENGGMVIGSSTRNTNLTLDLQSTTMSFGLPLLSTTTENGISATVRQGMVHYNTTSNTLRISDGTVWNSVITGSGLTTNRIPYWNGTSLVNSLATNNIADGGIDINSGYIYARKTTGGYVAYFDFRSTSGSAAIIMSQQTKALLVEGNTNRTTSDPASIIINRVTSGELAWFQAFDANATQRNGTSKQSASIYLQRSGRNSSAADIANDGYNVGIFAVLSPNTTANKDISGSFNFTQIDYVNNKGAWIAYISNIQVASIGQDGVSVGSNAINASAIFQVDSTTKGSLANPRMSTTQKLAILSPATGLEVFDTTLNVPQYYNGTAWVSLLSGSGLTTNNLLTYNGTNVVSVPGMALNDIWGQTFGASGTAGSNGNIFSVLNSSGSKLLLGIKNDGSQTTMGADINSFGGASSAAGVITFDKNSTYGNLVSIVAANTTSINYIQGWLNSGQSIYGFRYSNTLVALWQSNDNTASTILQKWSNASNSQIGVLQNDGLYFGSGTKSANAAVQVDSTTQGFLPPRMTEAQRTVITGGSVPDGLIVYQTDGAVGLYLRKSGTWVLLTSLNNILVQDLALFNYALTQQIGCLNSGTVTTIQNIAGQLTAITYRKWTQSTSSWGSLVTPTFTANVATVSISMLVGDALEFTGTLVGSNTQGTITINTQLN